MDSDALVQDLKELIGAEVIRAMGLRAGTPPARLLHPIFANACRRFAEVFAEADRLVSAGGLPAAARSVLPHLSSSVQVHGAQKVPSTGPLVVASNHPGTVDSILISAGVSRIDLKVIAGAIPFLQALPNTSQHLIFVPRSDPHGRMHVVRESLRHLQSGGALLIFGRGRIDPDPAFMPGADSTLAAWSRSLQVFLNHVPQARVLVTVVSGVLQPRFMRHPMTWFRRNREDRQRLAMMAQVIEQMLGRRVQITPRVVFGELVSEQSAGGHDRILPTVIEAARRLLTMQTAATSRT